MLIVYNPNLFKRRAICYYFQKKGLELESRDNFNELTLYLLMLLEKQNYEDEWDYVATFKGEAGMHTTNCDTGFL